MVAPESGTLVLDGNERRQVLEDWNGVGGDFGVEGTVVSLFEAVASEFPEKVAVEYEGEALTYGELDARASRLAGYLRGLGVGRDVLVGLCVERSLEMVVGILGVLKAGGAYVPLDPDYPEDRLRFMLEDTDAPVLVTLSGLSGRFPFYGGQVVCLDADAAAIDAAGPETLSEDIAPGDLAYVMYTSGSTGTPKGVCVEHRGVVRLVRGADYVALGPDEVLLQLAPASFDASTFELWGSLLNGGKLVVLRAGVPSLEELAGAIRTSGVSVLWLTTALFNQLVDADIEAFRGVGHVVTGGEVMSVVHARRFLEAVPACRLSNVYGPTENTTFTTSYPVPSDLPCDRPVPIGRPISNTQVYILDKAMHPVPIGVTGEIYAGGDGLARGYLNRPALTAERFVANPFIAGERLYRTGDLGRHLADGTIEFLGREDDQVKLRGYRIELGEVETVLTRHEAVRECRAMVREDVPGDRRLVAYIVPRDGHAPEGPALRAWLADHLPAYMVPSAFVTIDAIPLTPAGKLDKSKLPAPDADGRANLAQRVAPRNETERGIHEIWSQHFGASDFGVEDNFFDIGGHSLLAMGIVADIDRRFGISLPLSALFENPTPAAVAQAVESRNQASFLKRVVPIQTDGVKSPLFAVGPTAGSVLALAPFVRALGKDHPFYGLEIPGYEEGYDPLERIEDIAAWFVDEVQQIEPEQPCIVLGLCSAALVAFELAQQLKAQGRTVDWVVMIDPSPHGAQRRRTRSSSRVWRSLYLPRFLFGRLAMYWQRYRLLQGADARAFAKEKLLMLADRILHRRLFQASRRELKETRTREATVAALEVYSPSSYDGQTALLLGERFDDNGKGVDWSTWKTICTGDLRIIRVPGASTGAMLKEPIVSVVSEKVRQVLADELPVDGS